MPYKTAKICPQPNCNTVIKGNESHCAEHKEVSWGIKRQYNPFYSSSKWRNLSKAYRSSHPLCEECKRKGIDRLGKHADHIKPIEDGGAPYDWNNLNNLCVPCHSSKTAKEIRKKK